MGASRWPPEIGAVMEPLSNILCPICAIDCNEFQNLCSKKILPKKKFFRTKLWGGGGVLKLFDVAPILNFIAIDSTNWAQIIRQRLHYSTNLGGGQRLAPRIRILFPASRKRINGIQEQIFYFIDIAYFKLYFRLPSYQLDVKHDT